MKGKQLFIFAIMIDIVARIGFSFINHPPEIVFSILNNTIILLFSTFVAFNMPLKQIWFRIAIVLYAGYNSIFILKNLLLYVSWSHESIINFIFSGIIGVVMIGYCVISYRLSKEGVK